MGLRKLKKIFILLEKTLHFCPVFWNKLLQKVNIVSKALQESGLEVHTLEKLYNSLITFFTNSRDRFEEFEKEAKLLVSSDYKIQRSTISFSLSARDQFRTQTFLVIIDKISQEMQNRKKAYTLIIFNKQLG